VGEKRNIRAAARARLGRERRVADGENGPGEEYGSRGCANAHLSGKKRREGWGTRFGWSDEDCFSVERRSTSTTTSIAVKTMPQKMSRQWGETVHRDSLASSRRK